MGEPGLLGPESYGMPAASPWLSLFLCLLRMRLSNVPDAVNTGPMLVLSAAGTGFWGDFGRDVWRLAGKKMRMPICCYVPAFQAPVLCTPLTLTSILLLARAARVWSSVYTSFWS